MGAHTHGQWNPDGGLDTAAKPIPVRSQEQTMPSEFGLAGKLAALRAGMLAGGFHFLLRLILLLKAWNF